MKSIIAMRSSIFAAGCGGVAHKGQRMLLRQQRFKSALPAASFSQGAERVVSDADLQTLREIEKKLIWLSAYTVHHANNLREKTDSLKVGGHQASSTSLVTIMTALYFKGLAPHDRVAVKPHASPVMHAIFYMMGKERVERLQNFRGFGGAQSYPSVTKDAPTDIDYSTGSVGLGAAVTTFSALLQDYLKLKGIVSPLAKGAGRDGRMIALVGDAELDEGNVYEALMESWKVGIRNNWWFIDYNRQSLDKVTENRLFRQIDRMFRGNNWNVVTLKYGKKLERLFREPGGQSIKHWLNSCDNSLYCALTYRGGKAFRDQMTADIHDQAAIATIARFSDAELFEMMTNLGGHCLETILEALHEYDGDAASTAFIAYTVKGYGLPMAGHRDNHGLFLNQAQMDELQARMNVPKGREWDALAGVSDTAAVKAMVNLAPINSVRMPRRLQAPFVDIPKLTMKAAENTSTQAAFGQVMLEIGRSKTDFASRVITTAPDVTTSTNLIGFVNQRGVFGLEETGDVFQSQKVPSMNKWAPGHKGQHVPLGIAENNFFLAMTAFGMSAQHFGHRLFPVGTLYDPFIARGLDALNYGCYQDARFMLVATPSGITLAPEGGAHQSINTPLIGMSQPGLASYEPAYADELLEVMQWGFNYMQAPQGGSVYLRLSTRTLAQPRRDITPELRDAILRGAYWHAPPTRDTRAVIAFCGVVAPEAAEAHRRLVAEHGEHAVALLQLTSPAALYSDWNKEGSKSYAQRLLGEVPASARLVTVLDGHPAALAWMGSVVGHQVGSLGVTKFGQCGTIAELYAHYGIDADAIVNQCKLAL